ncbi:MAG: elongation factor P [Patescibacteria group bacterium]
MLTINDLKNKMIILIDGAPYQVLEVKHLHMGRGGSSIQTRIKNLLTDQVFSRNFKPADTFREANVEKRELAYLYAHRGEYFFAPKDKPANRLNVRADQIGEIKLWLKAGTIVSAFFLNDKLVGINTPIKVDLEVAEAPPGVKGDTVSGATKTVTLETGAKIQTPLFVDTGDIVRINTETGEYVERVRKASA